MKEDIRSTIRGCCSVEVGSRDLVPLRGNGFLFGAGASILPVVTTPGASRAAATFPWWNARILWLCSGSSAALGAVLLVAHRPLLAWAFLTGAAIVLILVLLGPNSGQK